jgi:hypothetical protein
MSTLPPSIIRVCTIPTRLQCTKEDLEHLRKRIHAQSLLVDDDAVLAHLSEAVASLEDAIHALSGAINITSMLASLEFTKERV